jgi:hypothetical protein
MTTSTTITNPKQALRQAMLLAITAPNAKDFKRAKAFMKDFIAMVSDADIADCQAEIERLVVTGLAEAALHAGSEQLHQLKDHTAFN